MKRFLALLILVLISSNYIYGQAWPKLAWYKTYNGPGDGIDVVQDVKLHNQNFYIAGRSTGIDTNPDFLVLKYSDKGDSLLGIRYAPDPLSWDEASSIAIDSYENIYVVGGSTFDQGSFYALFHKYSPEGNLIFTKNFNSNIDIHSFGDFVILDSNEDPIIGYRQWNDRESAKVTKYSSLGDSIWTVTIADDTSEYTVNYLLTDQANNIYVCLTQFYWGGSDVPTSKAVLVKINEAGEILWKTSVNGELPGKIILDNEQNVIMITKGDGSTIKFNNEGEKLWTNDSTNSIYPIQTITDVVVDSKNNIIVTGYEFGISSLDYRTKKISPAGAEIWAEWFESLEGFNDYAMGIAIDDQDNLYITGTSNNQDSIGLCYTVTYPGDGAPGWVFEFDLSDSTFEVPFRFFIGDSNFVYVAGFTGVGSDHDILAFKIDYGYGLDVKQLDNNIPNNFSLSQNYPNPFNPVTKIEFSIPRGDNVKIEIYDALGRLVSELVNRYLPAGNYSIDFNASEFSSGVYYYRLTAGSFVQMKKAVLLK
ncbi:MAG: hypothetical protein A2000_09160 [Ignavibacteria bacterium GWB2_36_8]|nr:MAG: hypothetical protein A2000_09160 [Ignavibacteria bacterium GWB2_36_8]